MQQYRKVLEKYIPLAAVPEILEWLSGSNVQLNITRSRTTKLGDYRAPFKVKYHKISVNHDLNKYQFLLTLVHEFAHLKTFETFGRKVKPHGKEWKQNFRDLMEPFLNTSVYPADLLVSLQAYMKNPSSSTSNTALLKEFRRYDGPRDYLTLEEIPFNSHFRIHNGVVFKKLEKLRKRYKCLRMDNNRVYLVSPLVKIHIVENSN